MNKNALLSGVIFGIIFLALGGFLFTLRGESTLILIIAAADIVFGLALIAGGFISAKNKASAAGGEPVFEEASEPAEMQSDYYSGDNPRRPEPVEDAGYPDVPDFDSMSPDEIMMEEQRLRGEVHRSSAEAHKAVEEAKQAIAIANEDERALANAQEESRHLSGTAQQNALREIDRLVRQATDSSNAAASAKQRARALRDEARRIAELHSKAVEAAAGSMDDDF